MCIIFVCDNVYIHVHIYVGYNSRKSITLIDYKIKNDLTHQYDTQQRSCVICKTQIHTFKL